MSASTRKPGESRLALVAPYLWLAFFFLAPFLIVLEDQPLARRDRAAAL